MHVLFFYNFWNTSKGVQDTVIRHNGIHYANVFQLGFFVIEEKTEQGSNEIFFNIAETYKIVIIQLQIQILESCDLH